MPSQVGEWLGGHENLAVATMHAYVDQEQFGDMPIDAALRQLLSHFRLPGAKLKHLQSTLRQQILSSV